ncbi:MAG: hypothetical protein JO117_04560 [Verrucomicrobia bacterium]|nr:hypothetical protein [Verrucomicrobiota bacterium]MBV9657879.1 hypothetical protein [Verrucomicrobiota bacterium]
MAERFKFSSEINPPPSSAPPATGSDTEDDYQAPILPASPRPAAAYGGGVGGHSPERLDSQVQKAQEQLAKLKREQELIERQKRELEELSRRQDELERGKAEMTEKLTRALVIIERQTGEAQKRVEQLRASTESFTSHLRTLESIQPKSWANETIPKELNRALSAVDHARSEFNQSRARLQADALNAATGEAGAAESGAGSAAANEYDELFNEGGTRSFVYWLKTGLAFTLPLLVLGLIAILVQIWLFMK